MPSRCPNSRLIVANIVSRSVRLLTSARTARLPARSVFLAACSDPAFKPQMATRAPSLSNSCAAASPIPLLPPVIRIFLSVNLPNVVAPFSLVSGAAWHELQHPFTACFHNARDSLLYRRGGAGNLGSQGGNRAPRFRMFTVFRSQVPPDNFFPALCGGYAFQCRKGFFAKLGIARFDGFGEKLVFAAEMLVKTANREARRLHNRGDAGPIQALRPKSTSSVLQDSLVSSRLVILFVSHTKLGLQKRPVGRNKFNR